MAKKRINKKEDILEPVTNCDRSKDHSVPVPSMLQTK